MLWLRLANTFAKPSQDVPHSTNIYITLVELLLKPILQIEWLSDWTVERLGYHGTERGDFIKLFGVNCEQQQTRWLRTDNATVAINKKSLVKLMPVQAPVA